MECLKWSLYTSNYFYRGTDYDPNHYLLHPLDLQKVVGESDTERCEKKRTHFLLTLYKELKRCGILRGYWE